MASDTPRTVAVCEKLIAWATKNPNATIGDVAKFIVETFTEDMAEVERELNEAQKTITEFREWSIGGVAASEWKNRAETAEAKLAALQMERDSLDSSTKRLTTETRELCALFRKATGYTVDEYTAMLKEVSTGKSETRLGNAALQVKPEVAGLVKEATTEALHQDARALTGADQSIAGALLRRLADALLSQAAQLATTIKNEQNCWERRQEDAQRVIAAEAQLAEKEAENAKLRTALQRIADWGCIDAKQWDGPCASALCEVAKAALDFPKETDK